MEINFSVRLRILIEEKLHLTQSEFANNIGISQGYLSMILGEKRGPSAELISGIYIHYSEHLHWLLTGIDRPPVNSARTLPLDSYLNDALKLIRDHSKSNISRKGIVKILVSFYVTRLKGVQDTNEYVLELKRVFERFGLELEKEDIRELYVFLTEKTLSLLNIE